MCLTRYYLATGDFSLIDEILNILFKLSGRVPLSAIAKNRPMMKNSTLIELISDEQ